MESNNDVDDEAGLSLTDCDMVPEMRKKKIYDNFGFLILIRHKFNREIPLHIIDLNL